MSDKNHPIKDWLLKHGHSQSWLARRLDIKRQTVSRWITWKGNPEPELAYKLEELTEGELTVKVLMDPQGVIRMKARADRMTLLASTR